MKKIASGLQYHVYDLGNGKVLKKETSKVYKLFKLISWTPYLIFKPNQLVREINNSTKSTQKCFNKLKNSNVDFTILGNPKFEDKKYKYIYTQDKVKILSSKVSCSEIDLYIESIFDNWKNGFCDEIFNFSKNSGIDKNGKVILIDLGELVFSKDEVLELIKIKRWLKSYSYFWISRDVKKYYVSHMEKNITKENLNKYWNSINSF